MLIGILQLGTLFRWNHHVCNPDGNTSSRCLAESQVLQAVKGIDGRLKPRHLISAPDNIRELLLGNRLIDEAKAHALGIGNPWPDLVKTNPPRGGFNHHRLLVSVNGVIATIRIGKTNLAMKRHGTLRNGKFHLGGRLKERYPSRLRPLIGNMVAFMSKEITAKRDILRRCGDRAAT